MNETPANSTDPRIEAALQEYLERLDRGEAVDREAFLGRYPEIADALRSFIAAEEELRKLAGDKASRESAASSTRSFAAHGQETVLPQLMAKRNVLSGTRGLEGRFGRYRIIRALGKGAMGTVYLAEDTQIEREVALKTPHFTEDPTGEQMERFFREARAAGNLRHPHICPIYDFGQIDGRHFITMAYIEGRPLSAFIQPDNQQAERQILLLVRKLASALQEAHDHGVVHRDLKPANIMVDKKGEPIIMDFGLAQQTRPNEDVRLTQTGNILGTPAFMSPEQVEGEPEKIGPPSDQYSLGVILYELLTGELPFRGSIAAVMGQILTKEASPPSQRRPDLDPRIEAVCLKMMAKNPAERFRSLKVAADEISSILKSPAAKAASNEQPASSPASSPTGDRMRADVGASQVLKSLKQKTLTEKDLESLEELARKCYSRRDFEQVIQIIERVPEKRRNAALQALLEKSRGKTDEISFLICDIDEAVRLNDRSTALKKAEDLLKIKPGHHRARAVQEKFSGYGEGGAARIGLLKQFTQPWNEGGWIPWSVLAFGLAVFGVMTGVIVIYLGRTAVVIDIKDPGVEVAVKGSTITLKGPTKEEVKVEPGENELAIAYGDLQFTTKSFTLKRGEKRTVTISVVDSKVVAELADKVLPLTPNEGVQEKKAVPKEGNGMIPGKNQTAAPAETLTARSGDHAPHVPVDPDRRAAEAVLALGGSVTIRVNLQEKKVELAKELPAGTFKLVRVYIHDQPHLTDAALEPLRGAMNLVDVNLNRVPITDATLEHLQDLAKLEILNLPATRVTDTGLVYLKKLIRLKVLNLEEVPVTDAGLANLEGLTELDLLWLGYTRVSDAGLVHLERLAKLRLLNLGETSVTDAGLAHFKDCKNLTSIWLVGTKLTDAGLQQLASFRKLTFLFVKKTTVTESGVNKLAAALPRCKIEWDGGVVGPNPNVAATSSRISGRPFFVRGEWRIEDDELVQPTLASTVSWPAGVADDAFPLLVFGEETLSNYDLTLEVKKTGGFDALGIRFHWLGPGHYRSFLLAGNRWIFFDHFYNGKWGRGDGNSKGLSFSSNRWYLLKVEARGDTFRAYLDGVLQFEQTDARFTHGRICLITDNAAARFRRIKVSDPQGSVLFEGLPELTPASNETTPKANNGHSSHLLTAGETAAKSAQKQWAERLKTSVISTNSIGIKLALIPPGEFQMGSPQSERKRGGDEQQHRVRITKPFYLGVYEVTQSEFEHVMGRNPSWFSNSGGQAEAATGVDTSRNPVENVTWYDAVEFCNKLSEKEGRQPYYQIADIKREGDGWIKDAKVSIERGNGYRLPTEAQWEYACRAGTTTPFNFGTANNGADCNCNGKLPYGTEQRGPALGRPVPVGSYRPNAFGLCDMHGNVNEWCWDVYDEAYYKHSAKSDPGGPSAGSDRVHRGGSFWDWSGGCRSGARKGSHGWGAPGRRYNSLGFRLARSSGE